MRPDDFVSRNGFLIVGVIARIIDTISDEKQRAELFEYVGQLENEVTRLNGVIDRQSKIIERLALTTKMERRDEENDDGDFRTHGTI